MAQKTHVFCVPFPGAGHGVNMLNAAVSIATPTIIVHVLVMSKVKGHQWLKATGQAENPNVHIEGIADGAREDWREAEPRELVTKTQSAEFNQAVDESIRRTKKAFPSDHCTAIVINGLMIGLINVAKENQLKLFLLSPTARYMMTIAASVKEGDGTETPVVHKGIGGSKEDLVGKLGDFIECLGPMWNRMAKPSLDAADGSIFTNTNNGLDGDEDLGRLTPAMSAERCYMVGPILPPWYEQALDNPKALQEHQSTSPESKDPAIQFMNSHPAKSVVYVALGSHVQLSPAQAQAIITNLRKHQVPWVLLFRDKTEAMKEALQINGSIPDGVVTSWAPQLSIMQHPALKCVVSHGGFGTMVEGVYAGQPFITSPVMSDQFADTRVMQHLGICLGSIAVNKYISVMERGELTPLWPDDDGKSLEELFDRVFGTEQGEKDLENARDASKRLRRRMLDAKESQAKRELERLRTKMTTT